MNVFLLHIMLRVTVSDSICSKLFIQLLVSRLSHAQITFKAFASENIAINGLLLLCDLRLKIDNLFLMIAFVESVVSTLCFPGFYHDKPLFTFVSKLLIFIYYLFVEFTFNVACLITTIGIKLLLKALVFLELFLRL